MAQAQQPQGLHSLSTIIKRLEAVTSRLEDVAISQANAPSNALRSPTGATHDHLSGVVGAGAVGAAAGAAGGAAAGAASSGGPPPPPPPPPPPAPPAPAAEAELKPAVKAYSDEIVDGALAEFIANSKKVGGIVEEHSALVVPLVEAQLDYLKMASEHSKPAADAVPALLKPQADAIGAIMQAKDKLGRQKEGREWGAALSILGEGASAWGWVQVEPAPAPFVGEMKNAAQFWVDRVIKQFKETNADAVAWARSFTSLVDALQKYVKQWHTTGVTWDPKGPAAPTSVPKGGSAPSAPPPPPPPAPEAPTAASSGSGATPGGHAALLASLNQGGAITSGLRKVSASEQTHKNPELRAGSTVPETPKKTAPPTKPKPASFSRTPPKKPAKFELEDGNKWVVEYQEDNKEIVIDETALHHTVHIFACKNSVIRVNGKINALTMVNCKRTSIVVENAVSGLSITSSPSFEAQVTGVVPTIQIDTTDSGQVYLSKECMELVEVITSKTSAINISVPTGADGDFVERPVPEQMKTRVIDGKLVTEIVEHAG